MSTAATVLREFHCARKTTLRDPQAAFITIGLPLLYLFIFATVFGDQHEHLSGQPGNLPVSTVVVSSVIVIGVFSASFQNLTTSLVEDRENGVLKRLRSTPVATSTFLAGPILNALIIAGTLAVLVTGLGRAAYGVSLPAAHVGAAIVTVLVGAASCCAVACLFTVAVRKATAATPMLTAVTLTLYFLSGNFFSTDQAPTAFRDVANVFPVRHLLTAMTAAFNPHVGGAGFALGDLAVLAGWGIVSAAAATRLFRWTPVGES